MSKDKTHLFEIAHSRTGDKGNTSIISLIPYHDEDYDRLKSAITAEKVAKYFSTLGPIKVTRYELPNLPALNFVITHALRGGVTYSLNLDRHGKSLSSLLLDMTIS